MNEGWHERRQIQQELSELNSELCKKWKLEQKRRDAELETLLKAESVRQFRERIAKSGQRNLLERGQLRSL